jgi:hypothetical protein
MNQLGGDSNAIAVSLGASLYDPVNSQFVRNLGQRLRGLLVLHGGSARDHPQRTDLRKIAGSAFDQNTGDSPAFLAVPCVEAQVGDQGCRGAVQSAIGLEKPKVILPEKVRKQLQHRMRFGRL